MIFLKSILYTVYEMIYIHKFDTYIYAVSIAAFHSNLLPCVGCS